MQATDKEKATIDELRREIEELRSTYEAKLSALSMPDEEAMAKSAEEARFRAFLREQEKWLNEYVEVRLFKDNEKYKDDVYVAINGKNCVIRRGVWTRIRRKFALLLDQSEIQDLRTAELMEREAGRFADESRMRHV
ncbi:MAG: hypothetical protein IJC99_07120 [Clostridia bacterium]|nr:hypothetical protein [Clostridia bacterium]